MSGQRRSNPNPYKPGREPGGVARWLERQPSWQEAMRQKARDTAARALWGRVHGKGGGRR